ncbi:MAG: inner membrane CreD family protein, partial [Burkholderiaceae bacterium]
TMFGALYLLLHSEQNAVLIGSLVLFSVIAAIMIGTRNVDWFAVFEASAPTSKATAKDMRERVSEKAPLP